MIQSGMTWLAASKLGSPQSLNIPNQTGTFGDLTSILNVVYGVAGSVAVIVMIVAGIMYMTASGDSGKVAKAKNALIYAVIGLVLVIGAFSITYFIMRRVS